MVPRAGTVGIRPKAGSCECRPQSGRLCLQSVVQWQGKSNNILDDEPHRPVVRRRAIFPTTGLPSATSRHTSLNNPQCGN
jgi:hypothetical protein